MGLGPDPARAEQSGGPAATPQEDPRQRWPNTSGSTWVLGSSPKAVGAAVKILLSVPNCPWASSRMPQPEKEREVLIAEEIVRMIQDGDPASMIHGADAPHGSSPI